MIFNKIKLFKNFGILVSWSWANTKLSWSDQPPQVCCVAPNKIWNCWTGDVIVSVLRNEGTEWRPAFFFVHAQDKYNKFICNKNCSRILNLEAELSPKSSLKSVHVRLKSALSSYSYMSFLFFVERIKRHAEMIPPKMT